MFFTAEHDVVHQVVKRHSSIMRILEMKKQEPHHKVICQKVDPMCVFDAVQKGIDDDIVHGHICHDAPESKRNESVI